MSIDRHYIPHYNTFRLKCYECTPDEYQRLFSDVMVRTVDGFQPTRPWGLQGDWTCDGHHATDCTVYAVYSPDVVTLDKLKEKAKSDLEGAKDDWPAMKSWVFVYNSRGSRLASPLIQHFAELATKHAPLAVSQMNQLGVWSLAAKLPPERRQEFLQETQQWWLPFDASDAEIDERVKRSRFVILHPLMTAISGSDAVAAMLPELPFGAPVPVVTRPNDQAWNDPPWDAEAEQQAELIDEMKLHARQTQVGRFAVFSLAPIPLVAHLGFKLTDQLDVKSYQWHREEQTWAWPLGEVAPDDDLSVTSSGGGSSSSAAVGVIRVSLSASIAAEQTRPVVPGARGIVDVRCEAPSVLWLRHPEQVEYTRRALRQAQDALRQLVPNACRWHAFLAAPTPCALEFGRVINPRMCPPVDVYHYQQQRSPEYARGVTLKEAAS